VSQKTPKVGEKNHPPPLAQEWRWKEGKISPKEKKVLSLSCPSKTPIISPHNHKKALPLKGTPNFWNLPNPKLSEILKI